MAGYGRHPDSLKVMPGLTCCVAESRAQAEDEFDELQDLTDPAMGLALLSQRINFDFPGYSPDDAVSELPETADGGSRAQLMNELLSRNPGRTLPDLYKHFAGERGHGLVVGTPADVADHMEKWFKGAACDGFNMMPSLYPRDLHRFNVLVAPELQRRGLYRTSYTATTLRGNLGLARPAWSAAALESAS